MKYKTSRQLLELVEDVSHNPEEEDWSEVEDFLENISSVAPVLQDILEHFHKEYL